MIVIWSSWFTHRGELAGATDRATAGATQCRHRSGDRRNLASAQLNLDRGPIEIRQLGQTYNALLDRLSQSLGLQRQFVSAVSHELGTPLTIVQGYLQRTIRRQNNLSEAQIKGLQVAKEYRIRMRQLLDDLLDLSRSDSGRLVIDNEPVHQQPVGTGGGSEPLNPVPSAGVAASGRRPAAQPGGERRPRQAAAGAAGSDRKRRQVFPLQGPIQLALRITETAACIDVIDQGIGIPEDELQRVFDRFQRASNAPQKTGSGLGLSIVKLLVEGMGGRLRCAVSSTRAAVSPWSFPDDRLSDSLHAVDHRQRLGSDHASCTAICR